MASLKRGLVDTVKKAAKSVGKRGAQVAAKAGTRGARALVETTAAAVKTVDKLQSKLGRAPRKASVTQEPMRAQPKATPKMAQETVGTAEPKAKRAAAPRQSGSKAMPTQAVAAKRSTAPAPKKEFKAKRGQKHLHTGR